MVSGALTATNQASKKLSQRPPPPPPHTAVNAVGQTYNLLPLPEPHSRLVGQQCAVVSRQPCRAGGVCVAHVNEPVGQDSRDADALNHQDDDRVPAVGGVHSEQ